MTDLHSRNELEMGACTYVYICLYVTPAQLLLFPPSKQDDLKKATTCVTSTINRLSSLAGKLEPPAAPASSRAHALLRFA